MKICATSLITIEYILYILIPWLRCADIIYGRKSAQRQCDDTELSLKVRFHIDIISRYLPPLYQNYGDL